MHYVRDVIFKEDDSKIITGSAPENYSIIRNIAINIFRENEFDSIISGIRLCRNKIFKLRNMIC